MILIDLSSANTTFVTIVDAGPRGLGRPANRTSIEQPSLSAIKLAGIVRETIKPGQ